MVRLCSLAEPTGPAQVFRAYLYMMSPGRAVFQQPARVRSHALCSMSSVLCHSLSPLIHLDHRRYPGPVGEDGGALSIEKKEVPGLAHIKTSH